MSAAPLSMRDNTVQSTFHVSPIVLLLREGVRL